MHAPLTVKVMNEAASSSHARRADGRGASAFIVSDTWRLHLLDPGLRDDRLVELDFLGEARPGVFGTVRTHLEAGLVEPFLHLRRAQNFQRLLLEPGND